MHFPSTSMITFAIVSIVRGEFLQMSPTEIDLSSVIKNITGITITACYMQCSKEEKCDSFGITEKFDDHLHICHLITKSNKTTKEKEKKMILQGSKLIKKPSPVNGGFSAWKNSTSCSSSCGVGHVTYTRSCDNPKPQHGGEDCCGKKIKTERCLLRHCQICYGCKNNEYAKFTVWKTGQLKSIRLTHSSGSLYCVSDKGARWGCPWSGNRALTVVVTNEQNQLLFPESIGSDSDHYKMKDATINDNQITLSRSLAIDVHNGQILKIWDYQDLKDHYEDNNSGKHCVYVELIYKE